MRKRKIALLSNITVDLIKQKLELKYEIYLPEGYNTWIQEILNPDSGIYREEEDAVIILLDGIEAEEWSEPSVAEENLNIWRQGINALVEKITDIPIFIPTVDFRENRIRALSERQYRFAMQNGWYQFVQDIAEKTKNVYVYDLVDEIADIGRNQFYSNKMWYMSSIPYSREGMLAVCKVITRLMDSAFEPRKKIVVLDLDNTLWGGVIGEDGIEEIELANHKEGQRFYDFQQQLKEMQERGVLLAIVSKNNIEDVQTVFSEHPYMLLKEDSFVSKKINWNSKAENLIEVESELNLTEGSFVFIDDNPAERETVKGACPNMLIPDFPTDTTRLKNFAENLYFDYFRPLRVLEEDKEKTSMYQAETKRKQDFTAELSLDEYLGKLELIADIHRMQPEEMDRVVQLCSKTNQFNVTTKRYTGEEITNIAANRDNAIYVAYLNDKYGDSGLVSVIILLDTDAGKKIDTFLMSCRVMGRKLEDVIINELVNYYKGKSECLTAEYIPTAKNAPVNDLFDRLGFRMISEQEEEKNYQLKLDNYDTKEFSFYKGIFFKPI